MDVPLYLSSYKLGKTLGIGAFGKVKLAHHVITGQKVAIKILNKGRIKHMEMAEKVRREINILKMCTHPHISRLYEVIDTPSDIFVVMEYVSGGELFDYIVSRGRLPADEARSLFHQIVSSVEYCHFHKIVHRDLKPENLLLDADNNIKLADFGLSNVVHDGEFLRTSCGSPNYAAPEVISGNLYAGPEVDVWSCGVILYALLCGTLPFDDESIPNLFKKIKAGMYSLPAHLSQLSRDLILRMLVVDPMRRITFQEIRNHSWFQHKLPSYLMLPPEAIESQERFVDEEILSKVCELPLGSGGSTVSEGTVVEAISMKHASDSNRILHEVRVAYELLLDAKRHKQRIADVVLASQDMSRTPPSSTSRLASSIGSSGLQNSAAASSPLTGSNTLQALGAGPRLRSPSIAATPPMGVSTVGPSSENTRESAAKKRRWFLGIQSKKDPGHVMTEVYKALHAIGCTWYAVNNYRIICYWKSITPVMPQSIFPYGRATVPDMGDIPDRPITSHVNSNKRHYESTLPSGASMEISEPMSPSTRGLMMSMGNIKLRSGEGVPMETEDDREIHGISMRSVDSVPGSSDTMSMSKMMRLENASARDKNDGVSVVKVALSLYNVQQHIYLLDFQRSEGDAFSFMKVCAMIITELKNLAQASRNAISVTQLGSQSGSSSGVPAGALPVPPTAMTAAIPPGVPSNSSR